MSNGTRRSCLVKRTRDKKSRVTVPLISIREQQEEDKYNWSGKTGLPEQDQSRTTRTGQPEHQRQSTKLKQDNHNGRYIEDLKIRIGQPEQDQSRIRAGQPGKDSKNIRDKERH
jgi:hypothetical protein